MNPDTAPDDSGTPATAQWQDIDDELTCSTREMCVGYGMLVPVGTLASRHGPAGPWSVGEGAAPAATGGARPTGAGVAR